MRRLACLEDWDHPCRLPMDCLGEQVMLECLEGRLPPGLRDEYEAHLQGCSHCREIMALLARKTTTTSGPPTAVEPTASPPVALGRFRDLRLLGRGGMGIVYDAFDPALHRRVALKVLHPDRVGGRWGARLEAEARALASVEDLHVVTVYEVSRVGDDVFVAMELLRGESLGVWLAGHDADLRERVDVVAQAGRGLAAAHAAGLVHRDFKPSNVVVRSLPTGPRAIVIDFGLSTRDELAEESTLPSADSVVTATGALVGTPAYMAPEQIDRKPATARSDQYSFCVVLHEALVGRRPFEAESLDALRRAMSSPPTVGALRQSGVPRRIAAALVRGLSERPSQRWPNMTALLAELRPTRRPRRRVVGGLVLSTALVAGGFMQRNALACHRDAQSMDAVWNDDVRASTQRALAADASADRALRTLDAHATGWGVDAQSVCEGVTWWEAEVAPRACLDRRLESFVRVVSMLEEGAGPELRATDLVRTLRPSIDCRHAVEGQHDQTPNASSDDLEAIARTLTRARALVDSGRTREAEPLVRQVLAATAETGGDLAIVASLLQGDLAYAQGEESAAGEAWLEALTRAREAERPTLAGRAALRMAKVSQFSEADRWARLAIAEAGRIDAPDLAALAHLAMARVWHDNDDVGASREELALASDEIERLEAFPSLQEEFRLRRDTLEVQLLMRNDAQAALTLQRSVLARTEAQFGELHAKAIEALVLLGLVRLGLEDGADAIDILLVAVQRAEAVHGPEHLATAQAERILGQALKRFGSLELARDATDAARRIYAARDDLDGLAATLRALGEIERLLGDDASAQAHQRAAIDALRTSAGSQHPQTAMAELSLSYTLMRQGELDEASQLVERATRVLSTSDSPLVLGAIASARAHLFYNLGRPADAIEPYRRAIELYVSMGTASRRELQARANLANALLDVGRDREAAVELEAARALEPEVGGFSNADAIGARLAALEARVDAGRGASANP